MVQEEASTDPRPRDEHQGYQSTCLEEAPTLLTPSTARWSLRFKVHVEEQGEVKEQEEELHL